MKTLFLFFFTFLSITLFAQNAKIDSLKKVIATTKIDTVKGRTLASLSDEMRKIGDMDNALKKGEEGLKICEKKNDQEGKAICLNTIGDIYFDQGNYPKALGYHQKGLKIREQTVDKNGEATCLINIGVIYFNQGEYPKALHFYQKSMKIYEQLGDGKGLSECMKNIGNIYTSKGNYPKALEYYHAALVIHPKFIDALLNMGACHYRMERFDSAEVYWLRAQKLEATHPILKSHWELLSNKLAELAGDQYTLKQYEQAISMGQKALKYNPSNAGAYYVLGNTYGLMEKYPEAIKAFQKSTELNPTNADYWYNLGGVAYNGGQYDVCIDALTKTLALKPDYPRAKDGLAAAEARKK